MATMREVAARAGVSLKTVSRVFNDDPHVLPETRQHVVRVMRELNYVPNDLATTFRSGRSSAIGVAVPDIVDPFFAEIARAVDDYARQQNSATMLTSLGDDLERERDVLESLLSRRLSGLIVAPIGTDYSWLKRWKAHTPIVFVDRAPPAENSFDTFRDDDEAGARLATQHLIDHGHRRIAYVGDMIRLSTEINRLAGYKHALEDANLEFDDQLVKTHMNSLDKVQAALDEFRELPEPPTAVFSANARDSMLLVHALRGQPLALVGFGDFPMANVLDPSVTVVDQDPARLGHLAAERVFARHERPDGRFKRVNVCNVTLVERQSCRIRGF
jgi:LacI family transcriptional regulator